MRSMQSCLCTLVLCISHKHLLQNRFSFQINFSSIIQLYQKILRVLNRLNNDLKITGLLEHLTLKHQLLIVCQALKRKFMYCSLLKFTCIYLYFIQIYSSFAWHGQYFRKVAMKYFCLLKLGANLQLNEYPIKIVILRN